MIAPDTPSLGTPPNLLIVLGKNIGVGSTPEDMRRKPHHLSQESRLNALAAGALWTPETDILFSSGQTAGPEVPSEAGAMKRYFIKHYPDVPESRLLTEESSIDTAGNAEEIAKILEERKQAYRDIGLVTVGYHLDNAAKLFGNFGISINGRHASEETVRGIHPVLGRYVSLWSASDRVASEHRKERIRTFILPVDRKGKLLRLITTRSRK